MAISIQKAFNNTPAQNITLVASNTYNDLYAYVSNNTTLSNGLYGVTDSTLILSGGRYVDSDEILKRFHFGNEWGTASSNTVFSPGFEDPTYFMFKLEFGDWGYSLLDLEQIRSLQQANKFTNVYTLDYDLFPMGLLNINYTDFGKTANNWNDLEYYNSYNYLMNRNEDSRASYIQTFVKGLYAIQKDMPYIFQKITGIDKLQELNAKRGSRLQDVKLTIECIEGIDLKIKTLLEAYRKAAYDDIWQRWILPDIYRYFKLIIYVFDRRVLQTGIKTYSPEQEEFPIYAFECSPCEIEIESHIESDFNADYKLQNAATTKFTINVKNVKTYYSNALFNKVNSVKTNWFSDLETKTDIQDIKSTDITTSSNYKMRWMRKMFMIPSEYNSFYILKNIHNFGDKNDSQLLDRTYSVIKDAYIPDNDWHYAIVSDSIFDIHSWKDFKNYMKNLIVTLKKLIRDSRNFNKDVVVNDLIKPDYNTYRYNQVFTPIYLDMNKAKKQLLETIKHLINQMIDNIKLVDNSPQFKLLDPGLIFNLDKIYHEFVYPIINELNPNKQTLTTLNDSSYISNQELITPYINTYDSSMEMVKPEINEYISSSTMITPIKQDYNSSMNMPELLDTSYSINLNMVKPVISKYNNKQELISPTTSEYDSSMELIHPELTNYVTEQELISPKVNLSKADMDMINPILNLDKTNMHLTKPIIHTYNSDMELIHPELNLDKTDMEMINPILSTYNSSMLMINISTNEYNVNMKLIQPEQNLSQSNMEMVNPVLNTSIRLQEFVLYEHVESSVNMNLTKLNESEYNSSMNMIYPIDTSYRQGDMNMINIVDNSSHNNMNLITVISEEYNSSMNLITIENNSYNSSMNMVNIIDTSYRQGDMNMIGININENISNMNLINITDTSYHQGLMNMVNTNITDEHQVHNQLVIPNKTDFISNPDLIPLDTYTSKSDMDMTHIIDNIYDVSMDMININQDISILNNMDMVKPFNTSYNTVMDMHVVNLTDISVNMNMIRINSSDTSIDMEMVKPEISDYDISMKMLNVEYTDYQFNTEMVKPINSSYTSNMEMNTIIDNSIISNNVPMVSVTDNNYISNMEMIKPNTYEYNVSMGFVKLNDMDISVNMEMVKPDINGYDVSMNLTDNKVDTVYDVSMNMVSNKVDKELSEKVLMLTSLTDADISKADIELLLSLAEIIDKTVKQVKGILDNMVLTENKPNIPKHQHMEMVAIKQPPRRQFIADHLMKEVDDEALYRALNALRVNNKDNKSQNRRGSAL